MSYLDRLRETEKNLERAPCPTAKTDKTHAEAAFGSFVSTPPGPSQNFEADLAHRLWAVSLPGGEQFLVSCTPSASLAAVLQWHPGAILEPIAEPALDYEDTPDHVPEHGPRSLGLPGGRDERPRR